MKRPFPPAQQRRAPSTQSNKFFPMQSPSYFDLETFLNRKSSTYKQVRLRFFSIKTFKFLVHRALKPIRDGYMTERYVFNDRVCVTIKCSLLPKLFPLLYGDSTSFVLGE